MHYSKILISVSIVIFGVVFFLFNSMNLKDMTPVYTAKITLVGHGFNQIFSILEEFAKKHSLSMSNSEYQVNEKQISGIIELAKKDISIIVANPLANNEYKLVVRVTASKKGEIESLDNLISDLKLIFTKDNNIKFEETEIKKYKTDP